MIGLYRLRSGWPGLAPVENEIALGEIPGTVDLGEGVQVAQRGDHDRALAVGREQVVRDRVALAGGPVAVEFDSAWLRSLKTGPSASRPSST